MEHSVEIAQARHAWPEERGFTINRPRGIKQFTFLHFHDSVDILVGGEVMTTAPGTCIFYAADTPQWFCSHTPLCHDWMHMTGPVVQSLQAVGLEPDRLYTVMNGQFIAAIVRQIEYEVLSRSLFHRRVTRLKYEELLLKLARSIQTEAVVGLKPAMQTQLQQVRRQMFSQLDRDWTVAQMAALVYLSASRFHTLYRSAFGISPMEDLIQARIDTAKNRLSSTDDSVQDLAADLGYRNVTHFCRQFKQLTGVTPSQFRKTQE